MSVTFLKIDDAVLFNPCDNAYSHVEHSLTILELRVIKTQNYRHSSIGRRACRTALSTHFWSSSVANSVFPPYRVWHSLTIPINSFSKHLLPSAFLFVWGKWFVSIALIARKLCWFRKKRKQIIKLPLDKWFIWRDSNQPLFNENVFQNGRIATRKFNLNKIGKWIKIWK